MSTVTRHLILLLLLWVALPAQASRLDDAVTAMRVGDFAEAYCIMRPLAEKGDPDAQYNIGWMYLNGYGLRINDNLALEWWKKAAAQGHTDASFSIGMLYSLGDGEVPKDTNKAIDAYLIAARHGHEDAVIILKSMMKRNDKVMRKRLHGIMDQYASLFGEYRQVKANKLNARSGPSTSDKIVARLLQGQVVLVLEEKDNWSHVVMLENDGVDQAVWVYTPLLQEVESSQTNQYDGPGLSSRPISDDRDT